MTTEEKLIKIEEKQQELQDTKDLVEQLEDELEDIWQEDVE